MAVPLKQEAVWKVLVMTRFIGSSCAKAAFGWFGTA